ncbi:glycosyltransferase family 2 protein [Mesobaculum littorinae]|uniref:glycosyltransferase family 2 protein n=1 Tax=Mesobaculum littorinae TaxID=2486419 RepID=UPI001F3FD099|nr:glycosyltransferase family 2 protein [Mesobaculum littorinae]
MSGARLSPWAAYRLRLKRRRLLWRAFRARHALTPVTDRTAAISPGAILVVAVIRNEAQRLPYFLDHYRRLGVGHFLIVDNASDDAGPEILTGAPDVSLWHTQAGYKAARFGLDWANWLLRRHGTGHWCVTVDADELLVYPDHDTLSLPDLSGRLASGGRAAMGALMLDLYPRGPLGAQPYAAGEDPTRLLRHFDAGPYRAVRQSPMENLWVQGGVRERMFFADMPRRSPTLNKLPFVHWRRGYVYVNSTHAMLPRRLNRLYDGPGGAQPSGVLLHTKFLPSILSRSAEEKRRRQHFGDPEAFDGYYDGLIAGPVLWSDTSATYDGAKGLEALGLMRR